MNRPYNFSAGPAAMPLEVLEQAAAEMTNWQGSGMSVMEMSHRSPAFARILNAAYDDLREVLAVPDHFHILFMQGGGLAQNAIVPLNLSAGGVVDFVLTGSWSRKSFKEAQRYCLARAVASNEENACTSVPAPQTWQLSTGAQYVHLCSNETINGIEIHELPDLKALGSDAPLVMDFSSHLASRSVDWQRVGLAFGAVQKNLGSAGLTVVVVRQDLIGRAMPACPSVFDYKNLADHASMFNTPPTYAIYIAGLTLQWIKRQREGDLSAVAALEWRNAAKARLLYDYIDQSEFYVNSVAKDCRSRMNVPFFLRDPSRNAAFLAGAQAHGLLQLKGHQSVGGMRASLYNAMPLAGVQALVAYMRNFEQTQA